MIKCKYCQSDKVVKNGFQNGKQNRKCKDCQRNFTENDRRRTDRSKEKSVCFLLYSMGKASMRFLADIFGVSVRTVYVWIKEIADSVPVPEIGTRVKELEIDEMWHFLFKKLKNYGYSRRLTVVRGELSHGLRVVVMLQRYEGCTPN